MAFSRIAGCMSAAIGALSWSLILVRLFTVSPSVPSNNTRAVTTPVALCLRIAPSVATTRLENEPSRASMKYVQDSIRELVQ